MRTLFRGDDTEPVAGAALLIDGDRVVDAGPRAQVLARAPAGTDVVDLGDRFAMPGLIDAHVHLHFPSRAPGGFPLSLVEPPEYTVLKAAFNARAYLAAGVTSVMDCGTRGRTAIALRDAIARGLSAGPRVVASGWPLSPTGGWADDHPSFVENRCGEGAVADTPDEWRKAIREQVKAGVDCVKIGISGSALSPYSDPRRADMSREQIELVIAEARRAGVAVAGHCHVADGFLNAVRAGIDTIHHGHYIDETCLEALAEGRTYFVPTAMKLIALVEEGAAHGRPPETLAVLARTVERFREMLSRAVAAGLAPRIAAGSDAGNLPPAHGTTARELSIFVDAGMTPADAIRSTPRVAAQAIGLAGEVGTLTPGARADVLMVDGDPLADVGVLADPGGLTVYQGGRLVAEGGRLLA